MNTSNPTTPAPVLLLTSWSVTTTFAEKHAYRNSRPYRDTPLSRWEAARAIPITHRSPAGWYFNFDSRQWEQLSVLPKAVSK